MLLATENFESYFDEHNTDFTFQSVGTKQPQSEELLTQPLIISPLSFKDLSNGFTLTGTFGLYKTLLVFEGVNYFKSRQKYLDIFGAKLHYDQSNTDYGVVIEKNGQSYELICHDKKTFESWIVALRKVCVLTNFHAEYKASKMIGKGRFGRVYLADSRKNKGSFAVKAFSKNKSFDTKKQKKKAAIINEIKILKSLDHENIIKLHEVYETKNSVYLILDLVKGKSLEDVLKSRTYLSDLSGTNVIQIIRSIMSTLAYLASKGVMHRDLKPGNILVEDSGNIKIVDFGMANEVNLSEHIFKKGGTAGYIAPEVFKKEANAIYNSQCDVFSAGCILYNMISGKNVFKGSNKLEILQNNKNYSEEIVFKFLHEKLKSPKSKFEKEGINLLLKLLIQDPTKRISPKEALQHPFLNSPQDHSPKTPLNKIHITIFTPNKTSSGSLSQRESSSNSQYTISLISDDEGMNSPRHSKNFTEKSPFSPRFGKTESKNQTETLSPYSQTTTKVMRSESASSLKFSTFVLNKPSLENKPKWQNKSAKNIRSPQQRQSILKAAIFKNIQIQSEAEEDGTTSTRTSRRLQSGQIGENRDKKNNVVVSLESAIKSENNGDDSDEGEDVGDENSKISCDFEKFKIHYPKMSMKNNLQGEKTPRNFSDCLI